ncbi:hypothetical protein T484DRAFT_2299808 [Baffinella frigidus]|nr:hypothetical protein T484DRAFT_2299808 [Cryptophyta sp. CCMP2293]
MAKVKKVLPFNSKSKGETTVGGVQPGKTTRMQNELQEQYARAIQDGTVVQATQSWSTQPPGVYPPDPPRAAQQPGQKGVGAAKPKRDMNRKESANSMQLELMQMHQDNIKAGYIVPAVRGPSVSYVPTVVNKHAAAQLELQALYLDSLKQGSIIQARAPSQYYVRTPPPLWRFSVLRCFYHLFCSLFAWRSLALPYCVMGGLMHRLHSCEFTRRPFRSSLDMSWMVDCKSFGSMLAARNSCVGSCSSIRAPRPRISHLVCIQTPVAKPLPSRLPFSRRIKLSDEYEEWVLRGLAPIRTDSLVHPRKL